MKLGIVGYGDSGHSFASAAKVTEGVQLVMIGGRNAEKAGALATKYGCKAGTIEEMIASGINCVSVSTPPGRRLEDCLPFIERGIHIMIEKPMALTVEVCDRLAEAARKAGVKLMVTHTHRYNDQARLARQVLDSGELGLPIHVNVELLHDYFTGKRSGWQLEWAMSGGGVTMNPFIHAIDLARWLGCAEVKRFEGRIGFRKPGYDIEGNIEAWIEMENGALGFINVDGYGHRNVFATSVNCEGGALVLEYHAKRIDVFKRNRLDRVIPVETTKYGPDGASSHFGYAEHVREMRDAVERGGPLRSDAVNGRRNVEIATGILVANGVELTKGRKKS